MQKTLSILWVVAIALVLLYSLHVQNFALSVLGLAMLCLYNGCHTLGGNRVLSIVCVVIGLAALAFSLVHLMA